MSISLRKLAARLIAAVMTVSAVTAANAAALEQPDIASRLALLVKGVMLYEKIRENFSLYRPCALHSCHKSVLTARLQPDG